MLQIRTQQGQEGVKERSLAVLDLGSGTFRLVVYRYRPGLSYVLADELREAVALGEGLAQGRIGLAALERGRKALRAFADFLQASPVDEVVSLATSAVRDAENGAQILAEARALGLDPRVLPGEEEARLGVLAVANALPLAEAWVVDQGGGSAQVSRMEGRAFRWGRALPLGALRLTEAFLASDPPTREEVKALEREVARHLKALPLEGGLPLVGLGGNIRAMARLHQKRRAYPLDLLHGAYLSREAVEELYQDLLRLPWRARAGLGLQPDRARTLPASLAFFRTLMKRLRAPGLWVSGVGIREGVLFAHLLPPPHLLPDPRAFAVENLFQRYPFALAHRDRVKALARELFLGLQPLHRYGEEEARLLEEAAHLHDIGMHLGYHDHHKHGAYLVLAEPLFGFSHREQALLALLVRYHRRGEPALGGLRPLFGRGDGRRLLRLSAILRLAEMLERSRAGRVRGVRVELGERIRLRLLAPEDPWVERVEAEKQGGLFLQAFGLPLEVVWGA
ncbi:Exopolyphosphatase [Thermus sp. CCB_US3_UF1]|uniref:Ppx/GppA family phosphatase n=1 Tax=Thermus sp. TaxID=275 RepID=UPI000238A055|nr:MULTISPECIES: Ppx/GppA phosphatase family protein [unclassified Thermus]AEV16178.1 Exopolyphosphatase [Thermus sp. CCB_US3_UF1]MCX7849912.1 Ppx/GppA family phosphatase [Thermus sp.]